MKRLWLLTNIEPTESSTLLLEAFSQRGWNTERVSPLALPVGFTAGATSLPFSQEKPDFVVTRLGSVAPHESLSAVRAIESLGVPIINSADSLARCKDKASLAQVLATAEVPTPRSLYVPTSAPFEELMPMLPPGERWVVKLLRGTKGHGVMLIESLSSLSSVIDTFQAINSPLIIQEFIPSTRASDVRVLVVGSRVLGAVRRVARPGDFRSNMHLGGALERVEVSEAISDIASRAASAANLYIAGVDLMESLGGYVVLEVNSSPGLKAFAATGQMPVIEEMVGELSLFYSKR